MYGDGLFATRLGVKFYCVQEHLKATYLLSGHLDFCCGMSGGKPSYMTQNGFRVNEYFSFMKLGKYDE